MADRSQCSKGVIVAVNKELLKGTIPLMVLRLVSSGERYGYELIKLFERLSGGGLLFQEGTLYPVLHALERDKLVRSRWDTAATGRRRKYYAITRRGEDVLRAKTGEWVEFQRMVNAILTGEVPHDS